jgi:hypothetical protein
MARPPPPNACTSSRLPEAMVRCRRVADGHPQAGGPGCTWHGHRRPDRPTLISGPRPTDGLQGGPRGQRPPEGGSSDRRGTAHVRSCGVCEAVWRVKISISVRRQMFPSFSKSPPGYGYGGPRAPRSYGPPSSVRRPRRSLRPRLHTPPPDTMPRAIRRAASSSRPTWLHVAPCTCEVSREWCVWVQPALNARIHFTPRF